MFMGGNQSSEILNNLLTVVHILGLMKFLTVLIFEVQLQLKCTQLYFFMNNVLYVHVDMHVHL